MAIPRDSFHVSKNGREARLRLRNLPMLDTFFFSNNVCVAGQIDLDITWKAISAPVRRGFGNSVPANDPGAFLGDFADARCTGRAAGAETGFSFRTGPLTADDFFAELGYERNGVFL